MPTETEIIDALRVCYDPELGINIVDLGRVHAIQIAADADAPGIEPRARVRVELLPRDPEQDSMLSAQIVNRLLGMREISRANVSLVEAPVWSAERMTAAARHELSRKRGLIQLG